MNSSPHEQIPLLPPIPEELRLAAKLGTLIPFVGAGVSQLGGCPGWDEFATSALRFFVTQGKLDFSQFEQLSRLPARTRLSIAVGLEQEHKTPIDFQQMLGAVRDKEKNAEGQRIYGHLARLAQTFITTNYDEWLELKVDQNLSLADENSAISEGMPSITRTPYYRVDQFDSNILSQRDAVVHIHGSVVDRDSMVLTTSDYLERYASHRVAGERVVENPYLTFLGHAFRTKSILFVGYGLNELEILEYVIQKAVGVTRKKPANAVVVPPRHFMLQGFLSSEIAVMHSLRDYYLREFDIALLPFSRDQKNWAQLIDVVEHLAATIPVGSVLPSAARLAMEALLDD